MLAALEKVGLSSADVENILHDAEKERDAVAKANKILLGDDDHEGKMLPDDSRPERFQSVDAVREALFSVATTLSETIVLTPGDPKGNQARTRADKRRIELPTPEGNLLIVLTLPEN